MGCACSVGLKQYYRTFDSYFDSFLFGRNVQQYDGPTAESGGDGEGTHLYGWCSPPPLLLLHRECPSGPVLWVSMHQTLSRNLDLTCIYSNTTIWWKFRCSTWIKIKSGKPSFICSYFISSFFPTINWFTMINFYNQAIIFH